MPNLQSQPNKCVVPLRLSRLQSVDGEIKRSEYGVTYITAGLVRLRSGGESNWRILPAALRPAAPMFSGVGMQVDHASLATLFYPSLRDTAGVTFDASWNEEQQSIDGGARLYQRDDLVWLRQFLDELLEDQEAGREVPDIGLSAVLWHVSDEVELDTGEKETQTQEVTHVESVDFVFGPGAEGRLRDALASLNLAHFVFERSPDEVRTPERPGGRSDERPDECSANMVDDRERLLIQTERARERLNELNIVQQGGQQPMDEQLNNDGEAQVQTPPEAEPEPVVPAQQAQAQPEPQQLAEVAEDDRLERIEHQLERLTGLLADQAEAGAVHGMGMPPADPTPGRVHGMQTSLDQFAPVIDYLFGVEGAGYPDPQFRRADQIYLALTGDWEWRGVFNPDRVMLGGADTTTLPGMAVDAMNRVVQQQWASLRAYRWYEMVVAVSPNDGSTQDMNWIGVGGVGVLPTVAEKGAYTELDMADTKETDSFVKKGAYVGISLEMFRKSEIAKIQAVPKSLARSAVMTRSANIASIFTQASGVGPTLDQDSTALFHASHNNLATTAFGTDSTAWNAVDLEIWNQTEIGSGKPLAISPKYMLCNRALFRAALVVFGYGDGQPTTYVPEAMDRGPDDPRPWPIAVPDFADTNDWAAIVDPTLYPVIMMSYAQAAQGNTHPLPELFAVTSPLAGLVFSNDEFPVKVRDWYAYGVNGYRGIAKRNVA